MVLAFAKEDGSCGCRLRSGSLVSPQLAFDLDEAQTRAAGTEVPFVLKTALILEDIEASPATIGAVLLVKSYVPHFSNRLLRFVLKISRLALLHRYPLSRLRN
jgi:hypothetical protein